MAKGKSKKVARAKDSEAVLSGATPKKASVPRGVRKHLRELEGQLTDAARNEQKRMKKLERARERRQTIDSALDKLRGHTVAPPMVDQPAAANAVSVPTAKTTRPRTGSGRFAATPRPAAE
jgi:hypothetical protein